MKKLVLIDGNALVHRAFHALPPLTSPNGVVTNAVFGFSSILIKIIKELKPDYIASAFDLAGPTFRHQEFAEYKIHREKAPQELYNQIPLVKDVLSTFGIPVYEKQGYEADDLIGTLATRAKKENDLKTIIATGDLDTLQLVEKEKVVVFTLRKGVNDTVIYDEKAVGVRYGLSPEQLNDYRGLKGDPSDNIPGVPGVGEKTASDLIKRFGSLDGLYKFLEENKKSTKVKKGKTQESVSEKLAEKLFENKDQAFFSKQLSTIITDLDIDFTLPKVEWRENVDTSKIEKIFRDLGFASLLRRLPEIGLVGSSVSPTLDFNKIPSDKKLDLDPDKNNFYVTESSLKNLKKNSINSGMLWIGHDLKRIFKACNFKEELFNTKLFDTKVAAYLLNPDLKNYAFADVYYSEFKELPSEGDAEIAGYLWKLKERLFEKMEKSKILSVFQDIEMPLVPVLTEMELLGIKVDTKMLKSLLKSTNTELNKLETKIYKLAGEEFNINSPQQLAELLYTKLAIKGKIRKTGGGALSTAAPELEKLRDSHPIIDPILQYRELQKLKTTYVEPFPALVNPKDGRIHTTYNQTGAGTGRLSSEDPNLQNIPAKTEIGQEFRRAFVAEDGYKLVSLDYSQLELRIVADIAKDQKMIQVFKQGKDIHTATAAEIFEVPDDKVTKEMRNQAKVLNFGIIYGMGSLGFSRAAGVTTLRAREFITKYFKDFSGVAAYMEEMKEKAHKDGFVETIFGRKRQLLDIYSTIPQVQAQAERAAINHPVQGTEADLVKIAMINVSKHIHEKLNDGQVRLLLQVHDELVFEIKTGMVEKISRDFKKIMESVHQLSVPLIVDIKFGDNWQDMKAIV